MRPTLLADRPVHLAQSDDEESLLPDVTGTTEGLADLINRVVPEPLHFVVDNLVSPGLTILFVLVLTTVLVAIARRSVDRVVERMKQPDSGARRFRSRLSGAEDSNLEAQRREQRANALGALARSIATAVIWVIGITMALGQIGINLGPLIAGAGIIGVAVGFGAQDLVKDFLSGVFMLIEDQYGVGDIIDAGEAAGVVEGISLRSTRLRDINGTLWHIPNGEIRRVGNMSQEFARAMLDIGVSYDTDVDLASELILGVATTMAEEEDYREVFLDPPEILGVEALGADSVDIRLLIKTQPAKQWAIQRELRRRIKNAFDAAGLEIPFSQRTVWLRTESPVAVGDADTPVYDAPMPDADRMRTAIEASTRNDTGAPDDIAELLPDEAEALDADVDGADDRG